MVDTYERVRRRRRLLERMGSVSRERYQETRTFWGKGIGESSLRCALEMAMGE